LNFHLEYELFYRNSFSFKGLTRDLAPVSDLSMTFFLKKLRSVLVSPTNLKCITHIWSDGKAVCVLEIYYELVENEDIR